MNCRNVIAMSGFTSSIQGMNESNQMGMMETSYLISYKNDKVSKPASRF